MACPAPAIVPILVLLPLPLLRSPALARHTVPLERFFEVDGHTLANALQRLQLAAMFPWFAPSRNSLAASTRFFSTPLPYA